MISEENNNPISGDVCLKHRPKNGTVISGENDLATIYPKSIQLWAYELNTGTTPDRVHAFSHKKFYFYCEMCGTPVKKEIRYIANHGVCRCKKCGQKISGETLRKTLLQKNGSLAEQNVQLSAEWNYSKNGNLTPKDVCANSSLKVWWRCPVGHEYQATISNRNSSGSQCPFCMKFTQTSYQEQAIFFYLKKRTPCENRYKVCGYEADIYIEKFNLCIEYNGERFHTSPKAICRDKMKYSSWRNNGIDVLIIKECEENNFDVASGVISYKCNQQNSELDFPINTILDYIGLKPLDVDVKRDMSEIYSQYYFLQKGESLAVIAPNIAKYWDYEKNNGLTPEQFSYGSGYQAHWKCPQCGYEWQTTIGSKVSRGTGCPKCCYKTRKDVGKKKTICDGVVYDSMSEFSNAEGIRVQTLSRWLNNSSTMPDEYKLRGLKFLE